MSSLRDGKNAAFLLVHHPLSLQPSMENVTLCARKLFLIVESALFFEEELYLTPNRQMYNASHIIYKIKAIYTHAHMWTHVH